MEGPSRDGLHFGLNFFRWFEWSHLRVTLGHGGIIAQLLCQYPVNREEAVVALQLLPWTGGHERAFATVKYYTHLCLAVIGALLPGVFAYAQIKSGTIVVFNQTPSDFFIAADSRANYSKALAPDDNQCKVSAFQSSHVIFANSGVTGYISSGKSDSVQTWSANDEAKIAIPQKWPKPFPANAAEAIKVLTALWADKMKDRWQVTFSAHPEVLGAVIAKQRGGPITKGVFAIAFKGQIAIAMAEIRYTSAGMTAVFYDDMHCTAGVTICGIGELGVVFEHLMPGPFMPNSDQITRLTKLVELTEAEDKSGMIGGPIDALEMSKDGAITWKQRKKVCPDHQN